MLHRLVVSALVVLTLPNIPVTAQAPPDPSIYGQWAGPWDLVCEFNPKLDPSFPGEPKRWWAEIAHAVVLPPPNEGMVMFWCRRHAPALLGIDPLVEQHPDETFLWDPSAPGSIQATITVDAANVTGSRDLFCGGPTFARDGTLVSFGGTNWTAPQQPTGHTLVALLNNVELIHGVQSPFWTFDVAGSWNMVRARWYATAITTDDGIFVAGHKNFPVLTPPTDATWELASINPGVSPPVTWKTSTEPPDLHTTKPNAQCDPGAQVGLDDYPRLHQLASGQIMRSQKIDPAMPVAFFDRETCDGIAGPPERWLATADPLKPARHANNSVHIVDASAGDAAITEVVYTIGGGDADIACDPLINATDEVYRMVDPGPGAFWQGALEGVPQLNKPRVDGNAILLLDGSILEVGGYYFNNDINDCVSRRRAEHFKPPEVFASPTTSATWEGAGGDLLTTDGLQAHNHRYHSVGGLFPDGRAFSGGGTRGLGNTPFEEWHSIEIYSPAYRYQGGNPIVGALPKTDVQHGEQFTITMRLSGGDSGEFRIALIRPAAATHHFDFNQRYVILRHQNLDAVPPPAASTVDVFIPGGDNGAFAAPLGRYMLTVVDSLGRPSAAKWIRIVPTP